MSRISGIEPPNSISCEVLSRAQSCDGELKLLLSSTTTNLRLKKVLVTPNCELYCDASQEHIRPYIPEELRQQIFLNLHNISHPGFAGTLKLIKQSYVWPSMSKSIKEWCRSCVQCQKSKITRHTVSPLGQYELPSQRFSHIHIDLVGPLTPCHGYKYILTCIDRFTRWPEAWPIQDQMAKTVAEQFFNGWITRFGVPDTITSDQGSNFESALFTELMKFLGTHKTRTTAFNPKSNGILENFHRSLKAAIRCHETSDWVSVLPMVLMGIRATYRDELKATVSELVYGTTIKLPGELFRNSTKDVTETEFVRELRDKMSALRPVHTSAHSNRKIFIHPELEKSTHVFIRVDHVRRPLQQPYVGPYQVLERGPKFYKVQMNNKTSTISIDRLKPAFLLNDENSSGEVITRSGRTSRPVVRFAV